MTEHQLQKIEHERNIRSQWHGGNLRDWEFISHYQEMVENMGETRARKHAKQILGWTER